MKPDSQNSSTGTSPGRTEAREQIVEIVSDSGEGAQKAGQAFGAVCAKAGCGVWTVEIIPAEIKPPARSREGASGIRIRFGSENITNMGNEADLVIAFNEQVLYGRIEQDAFRPGTRILLDPKWRSDGSPKIQKQYAEALVEFEQRGFVVQELPFEEECAKLVKNPKLGKNMWILGLLTQVYGMDVEKALGEAAFLFRRKSDEIIARNQDLIRAGYAYAKENITLSYKIPPRQVTESQVVMNGNQALALGIMASGIEVVAMYPITPATSVSHHLGGAYTRVGGLLHQAEDEIAAIGFALGASYAGKTACTVTSGPGLALKTEFLGLAVMAELPLVLINVQRGGPSTGLPTKVEQGDLFASLYGTPGDAPKIVMAAATIEECFHMVITARKLAETFRGPVLILTDANLATGVQPIPRPTPREEWIAPPIDSSPWDSKVSAYDWDPETGISPRPIPGQPGGEYVLTGLAHTDTAHVAYDPASNEKGMAMRSKKLRAMQQTLRPPKVNGDAKGELLIVGWGSTLGAIEEALELARSEGLSVSSLHLRFLSPLEPGIKEIFEQFERVLTVGIQYSDQDANASEDPTQRRSQFAALLRDETLCDVGSWSQVHGQPLSPGVILEVIRKDFARARERRETQGGRKEGATV